MESVEMGCPGQDAHCANGDHCTSSTEVCAIDAGRDDHANKCCHCGEPVRA